MKPTQKDLMPGDCLLYKPGGFFGVVISAYTHEKISHVEVYAGNGMSWASRDGKGVGRYPLRLDGLTRWLRPDKFNYEGAEAYFKSVDGQKYDWKGLLVFGLVFGAFRKHGSKFKQFCSRFATNLYRAAGLELFGPYPSDKITPADFLKTELLDVEWSEKP